MTRKTTLRIGCGAGFWGDSPEGPKQLVEKGRIDYLVLDYLAEITMSLLAKARAKDPNGGFPGDFPDVIARLAKPIKAQGIKVVTNAAGVNPHACKAAIEEKLKALDIDLTIAVVIGDDLLDRAQELRESGYTEMFDGSAFPAAPWSINAYLGAFPIAAALAAGADIVLTGRCVDSAIVLGPLIHEFGWSPQDYDKLAMGSLAGHIVECGTQGSGGIVTDWRDIVGDWDNVGFPIAECEPDGRFVISKPDGTGGRITPATVSEQIVYEVGDPAAYILPDVVCDFSRITLRQVGQDRVEVSGATGRAPTTSYKVSATYQDGFRCMGTLMVGGVDAAPKALRTGEAILKRTRRLFSERGMADYRRTDIEVLGANANYGADPAQSAAREVILKVAVQHDDRKALDLFGREFIPAATAMAQGITGFAGGRPSPSPLVRLFAFLIPKAQVPVTVEVGGGKIAYDWQAHARLGQDLPPTIALPEGDTLTNIVDGAVVPLIALAFGRSGDKGDAANIGVLARRAEFLPVLRAQLTAEAVKRYFAHFVLGEARRFEWPGLQGFNFLLGNTLGGGGMASLRYDPQGKMLAQILMDFPIRIPAGWLESGLVDRSKAL